MASIDLEIADGIAVITLNNPEVRNALTTVMAGQLIEICDEIDSTDEVGATVLRGANGTFCSGSDTRTWDPDLLSDQAFASSSTVYESFLRFGKLKTPTIAAARGTAPLRLYHGGLRAILAAAILHPHHRWRWRWRKAMPSRSQHLGFQVLPWAQAPFRSECRPSSSSTNRKPRRRYSRRRAPSQPAKLTVSIYSSSNITLWFEMGTSRGRTCRGPRDWPILQVSTGVREPGSPPGRAAPTWRSPLR